MPARWIETSDGWIMAPPNQQPKSQLHKRLLDAVEDFTLSSVEAFVMNVLVLPGNKIDIVTWKTSPSPDFFAFRHDKFARLDRTLQVRYHDEVQVRVDGVWTPLTTYLNNHCSTLKIGPSEDRQARQKYWLDAQRDWWRVNKKSFNFVKLPPELRENIYKYCSPADAIEPYPKHAARGLSTNYVGPRNKITYPMLKSSKLVARELRAYMFLHTPLLFTHDRILRKTLRHKPHFPRDELRCLTLALPTHLKFLEFAGFRGRNIRTGDKIFEPGSGGVEELGRDRLPALARLEIVVPGRETLEGVSWLKGGCQVLAAEMVMESLWPFVKGQPVVLGGMVKKWQKKKWEDKAVLAAREWDEAHADTEDGGAKLPEELPSLLRGFCLEEDGHLEEDGSEEDDGSDEEDCEDGDDVWQLPFFCQCPGGCLVGEWTDEDGDRGEGDDNKV